MTGVDHIFFDIGGVLGSNGWDREQRNRAVEHFHLDADDFQWRHEDVVGEWEEGRITLDEYLDIAVFNTERQFTRSAFIRFMLDQSVAHPETVAVARALAQTLRIADDVYAASSKFAPAAESAVLVTNRRDPAVNNAVADRVAERWNSHKPEFAEIFCFGDLPVNHDIIDPQNAEPRTAIVYPQLLKFVEETPAMAGSGAPAS